MIYKLCVVADTKRTLRSPDEIHISPSYDCHYRKWEWNGKRLSKEINLYPLPGIPKVSHQTHMEALPVFYAENKFHYTIAGNRSDGLGEEEPLSNRNTLFRRNLKLMRHVSLALCEPSQGSWPQNFDDRAEMFLPECLITVPKRCGSGLRTLDLQLVSTRKTPPVSTSSDTNDLEPQDPIRLLNGSSAVASSLLKLQPSLESLTITGFKSGADMDILEDLCLAVAPDCFWKKQAFRKWPSVELSRSVATHVGIGLGDRRFKTDYDMPGTGYAYQWELKQSHRADSRQNM